MNKAMIYTKATIRSVEPQDSLRVMPVMESAFDPIYGEAWSHGQLTGMMAMPGSWLATLEVPVDNRDDTLSGTEGRGTASHEHDGLIVVPPIAGPVSEPTDLAVRQVAGFALLRFLFDEAELMLFAVAPEFRRYGFGRQLLANVLHEAKGRGVSRVFLEMRSDNNAALALYERAGFAAVGVRRGYYHGRDGILRDAVTMACMVDEVLPLDVR